MSHKKLRTMFGIDLGLLEPKVTGRKNLKRPRTSLDLMNNVKGQKIHLGDNISDEVGTQVGLHSKRGLLFLMYNNSHCASLERILVKRQC